MRTRHRLVHLVVVATLLLAAACNGQTGTPSPDPSASSAPPTPTATSRASASQQQNTPTTAPTPTPTATPTPLPPPTPVPPTPTPIPPTPTQTVALTAATVIEVVDGDTLRVSIGGQVETVRIIGVDTPETRDPQQPVMCYGPEATAFTQEMVNRAGGQVLLEKDVSERDRYQRLLRYVWLSHPDGQRMLNEELVKWGYAQVSTYPPDVKYQDRFLAAQREAREENRGLWGACGGFGVPLATSTPTPVPAPAVPPPATGGNCHPSYPDVCIPPPPPDLDCKDVPYRRFTVLPPDPHRFDADHDGIGCESR